jgi:hypothetical protein
MNKTSFSIIGYLSEQKPMAGIVQLYLKDKEKDMSMHTLGCGGGGGGG